MESPTRKIKLLSFQKDFIFCKSKKALLLAGIGTGKSFSGAHFVLNMIAKYPKANGLITANTYTQLVNATVSALMSELNNLGIPYKIVLGGSNKHIRILNTKIFLYSLEKPDNIRGIEVGWWWSDESAFSKKEAAQICRGRLRDKRGPLYERHTSSPNGYNWMYDNFENCDGENANSSVALFRGRTKDNIFLPEEYYSSLLEDYGGEDNPLAKQELSGQFVNLQAGAIYWAFDRDKHVKKTSPNDTHIVDVGQDFNIDNMCGVYVQRVKGHYHVFDENVLEHHGANTDAAASKIIQDLKGHNKQVIPDSTGRSRSTKSTTGRTDIHILESYGLEVLRTKNPIIRDRQNTLNILFKKGLITIDPKCKKLIKELETLSARDEEGKTAHVSVALGYIAWHFDPLKTKIDNRFSISKL